MKINFRNRFSKTTQISTFIKKIIYWKPSCPTQADGRTEKQRHIEVKKRFSQFCESDYKQLIVQTLGA